MPRDGYPPQRPDGTNHGRRGRGESTSPKAMRVAETTREVARLRVAGATFREIGAELGIDPTWAHTLAKRALEEVKYEAADLMRTQEGLRLDAMQQAYWPAAVGGDLRAAALVLRISERRARLFGLDAPVKVDADIVLSTETVDAQMAELERRLEAS